LGAVINIKMRLVVVLMLLAGMLALDVQRQLEYENTLDYLIELSATNRLHEFREDHFKKCVSLEC
jgi:hypothetical protein